MGKFVARLLATAALWVKIQTCLKKWAKKAKKWPTHSSPPKKYTKNYGHSTAVRPPGEEFSLKLIVRV